jgi:hypothetical protein
VPPAAVVVGAATVVVGGAVVVVVVACDAPVAGDDPHPARSAATSAVVR